MKLIGGNGLAEKNKPILDFIAEAGVLKRVQRSGWWMLGVPFDESVADHSFRCAFIGYLLAKLEGADPMKVFLMTLFGDIHEARINDQHKVAHKYLNVREAEKDAFIEQVEALSEDIKDELNVAREEYDEQISKEALVARDADILECLIQSKEYVDKGYTVAEKFYKKAPEHLRTDKAKELWQEAMSWDSNEWWEKITKFER
jgi:5'-deoxynucleotidase YfbR-like HD superfamily hydrolase